MVSLTPDPLLFLHHFLGLYLAEQVREVMAEEDRTMSSLIREALRLYMDDREWRSLVRYGQRRAREQGIAPEDVERLVEELRAKQAEAQGGRTDE